MAHNHGGGATPTGDGVPTYFEMQRMYWAVVGTAIGVATACNILNKIVAAQRYVGKEWLHGDVESWLLYTGKLD